MKLPVFNKCWCCELEIGGIILASIGIVIGGIISIILMSLATIILSASCDKLFSITYLKFITSFFSECVSARVVTTLLVAVLFVVVIIHILIYVILIKGVSNRNPEQIIPAVIIQGFGTVSIIAEGLLSFSAGGLLDAIIGGAFMTFFFLCLYSLYVKIRDEKKENQNEQLTQA